MCNLLDKLPSNPGDPLPLPKLPTMAELMPRALQHLPDPNQPRYDRLKWLVIMELQPLSQEPYGWVYATQQIGQTLAQRAAGKLPGAVIGLEFSLGQQGWYLVRQYWDSLPPCSHVLKCTPDYFQELWAGTKTAELRYNDRGYQEGDVLELQEWDPQGITWIPGGVTHGRYSGRTLRAQVTHLLKDFPGLASGWVMMSIEIL
jgi:hypothetical protein